MIRKYAVSFEDDGKHLNISKSAIGFSGLEILGLLEYARSDIIKQLQTNKGLPKKVSNVRAERDYQKIKKETKGEKK